MVFSSDGKRLASASDDKTVKIWAAQTSREILSLKGHSDRVFSAVFSPDGQRLVSASRDQTVRLWDVQTGQETLSLKAHSGGITSVVFSPDGNRLASAIAPIRPSSSGMASQILSCRRRPTESLCIALDLDHP